MKAVALRLDDELYEELKKIAKDADRSVNSEIIQAIKKHVKDNK